MFLFTIYVDNEYTAKKMETASKKLGFYDHKMEQKLGNTF